MRKLMKRYLKPYVPYMILALVLTLGQVYAELKLPDLMSSIVDTGIVDADVSFITQTGVVMLAWALLSMACVIGVSFCAARSSMSFGRDVRSAVFRKVESFSTGEFNSFGTSSLITRATNDVQQLERFFQMLLTISLMSPIMFVGSAFMAWSKSHALSVIIFITIPLLVALVIVVVRFGMPLLRSLQERIDHLNLATRENLTGMRVIRAYNREDKAKERFAKANHDLSDTNVRVARLMGALMPIIMLTVNMAIVVIIWRGAISIQSGTLLVGDLMAVIQYATMTLISVMMLSMIFTLMPRAFAAAERITEVLDRQPAIEDPAKPETVTSDQRGVLEFQDVSFTFPGAETPTLKDFSIAFRPGATTAIIGSTGSGKSTMLDLIMRFNDPTQGHILLDGCDIATMTQDDLRHRLAYVPQKAQLFSGTIAENIRVGSPDATDDEVAGAARIAAADDFISQKDEGYGFVVSQGGHNLSGGQRQRVAIARAVVRDAEAYIFDDSFSALDFKTDAEVRTALHRNMHGKTVLIVAQRVSVAMDADEVVVLDEGRIVGRGTHAELLQSCEVYREIAASQLDEDEIERSA